MIIKPNNELPACTDDIRSLNDALDILGNKWSLIILHYLYIRKEEVNTFKKIQKEIDGISAKMLSKELKNLEVNKLVSRTELATKPPSVAYALTHHGNTIYPVLRALVDWGELHRNFIFSKG